MLSIRLKPMGTDMDSKRLINLIELSSNVKFYVPSTANVDKVSDNSAWIDKVENLFSKWFGGATQYSALGCWQSPAIGLIKESIIIVESFCNEQALQTNIEKVVDLAEEVKRELAQESIAIEINNKLYLV